MEESFHFPFFFFKIFLCLMFLRLSCYLFFFFFLPHSPQRLTTKALNKQQKGSVCLSLGTGGPQVMILSGPSPCRFPWHLVVSSLFVRLYFPPIFIHFFHVNSLGMVDISGFSFSFFFKFFSKYRWHSMLLWFLGWTEYFDSSIFYACHQ